LVWSGQIGWLLYYIFFTLGNDPSDRFDKGGFEVLTSEIDLAYSSFSDKLLQKKVVGGRRIIVSVGLYALFGKTVFESQLDSLF